LLKAIVDGPAPEAGSKNSQKAYEDAAPELAALVPRLALVEIRVKRLPAGASAAVFLNDDSLDSSALGNPQMVDPGPIKVRVSAPGYQKFESSFSVKEGESKQILVNLEPSASLPPALLQDGLSESEPAPPPRPGKKPVPDGADHGMGILKIAGLVTLVTGGTAGSLLGLVSYSRAQKLKSTCTSVGSVQTSPDTCNQGNIDTTRSLGTMSNVGFVVAAAGLGALLWATLSTDSGKTASSRGVGVGLGPAGAILWVSF
jgi:hypothetical protein